MSQGKLRVVQVNVMGRTLSTGRTTWEMHQYFKSHGIESFIAVAKGDECEEAYAIMIQRVYILMLLYQSLLVTKDTTHHFKQKIHNIP